MSVDEHVLPVIMLPLLITGPGLRAFVRESSCQKTKESKCIHLVCAHPSAAPELDPVRDRIEELCYPATKTPDESSSLLRVPILQER